MKTLFLVAVVGVILFYYFGMNKDGGGYWNLNIPYPAGVTTNPAAVAPGSNGRPWNGTGYPDQTYVSRDWTAQPF